ncbi:phage distal tail protein [Longimycelium tulufanense]|uniref:phage distal tail protein n=1 Tax=Longimycelium tulufanense TaxID=907463 RepID=UPI0016685D8D|nr:phage tail family protein [Longimycelium tulufanense]
MAAGDLLTVDGQIEWRGLLLGSGTVYGWRFLTGWLDLPGMRDGDQELVGRHGAQPGQMLAEPRIVEFGFHIRGPHTEFSDAVDLLRTATAPTENPVEEPLIIQLQGRKHLVIARCTHRSIPTDKHFAVGYTQGALRWKATNPRLLELPRQTPSTRLPAPTGSGVSFPLAFPLDFGPGQSGGELVVTNQGTGHAEPVWAITGPVTGPRITNADTGARLWFEDDYTLPAGHTLELTYHDRTVLLGSGVSRSNRLRFREWFTLPPGTTRIRYTAAVHDPVTELTCLYHHTSI